MNEEEIAAQKLKEQDGQETKVAPEGMTTTAITQKEYDQPYDQAPSFQKLQEMLLAAKPKSNDDQIERNKKLARIRALGSLGESLADIAVATHSNGYPVKATPEDTFIPRMMFENRNLQNAYARENADWYKQYTDLHKQGLSDWTKWKMEKDKLATMKEIAVNKEAGAEDRANKNAALKKALAASKKQAVIKDAKEKKPYLDVRDQSGETVWLTDGLTHDFFNAIMDDPNTGQDEKERMLKLVQFDAASGTFKNILGMKSLVAEKAKNYPDIMEQAKTYSKQLFPTYYKNITPTSKTTTVTQNTTNSNIAAAKSLIQMVEKDYGTATTKNHIYTAFKAHGYTDEEAKTAAKAWEKSKQKK
jgi:hypothetical protein